MHFQHLSILAFLLATNLWHYGNCTDDQINEWLQMNNCLPEAPVALDFCTCKCSELNAALRSSPELQFKVSRRLQERLKSRREMQQKAAKKSNKEALRVPWSTTTFSPTVENYTPGVLKCWETCVDSLVG